MFNNLNDAQKSTCSCRDGLFLFFPCAQLNYASPERCCLTILPALFKGLQRLHKKVLQENIRSAHSVVLH